MGEYRKITKDDVDFPAFCLFFIKRIMANIEEAEEGNPISWRLTIEINTEDYPYCYDAFELVIRTIKWKGYETRIPNFHREKREGLPDMFHYQWVIEKKKLDDLPF